MNNRLLSAMKAAHVTINDIAELAGVDRRTVQRWMQGRIPHPGHRWAIVEYLKIREELIWPSDASKESADIDCSSEMIALYSHRANVPVNAWWHLLAQAHQHIDLLLMLCYFYQNSILTS
ncbi:MAG: helix-turn-helix transcriptional regulator [Ktedonobacteraceae bacterium]